ncbi:hypothetical protein [Methanocrinis sp.]
MNFLRRSISICGGSITGEGGKTGYIWWRPNVVGAFPHQGRVAR